MDNKAKFIGNLFHGMGISVVRVTEFLPRNLETFFAVVAYI